MAPSSDEAHEILLAREAKKAHEVRKKTKKGHAPETITTQVYRVDADAKGLGDGVKTPQSSRFGCQSNIALFNRHPMSAEGQYI